MNIQKLREDLIKDEGIRYKIYLDSNGYPTFGIGHLITKKDPEYIHTKDKNVKSVTVSKERVEIAFEEDIKICLDSCRKAFSDFDSMIEELQLILANMMFNLGIYKFLEFKKFILFVKARDLKNAAKEMQNSDWFLQVKGRAERLYKRMTDLASCKYDSNLNMSSKKVLSTKEA